MTSQTTAALLDFAMAVQQMADALTQERDLRVDYRAVILPACEALQAALDQEPTEQSPSLT